MNNGFDEKMGKFEKMYQLEKYNEDTICAIANIQKNKHLIKSRIKLLKVGKKFDRAFDMVVDAYPQADRGIVTKELMKIGIFRRSTLRAVAYLVVMPSVVVAINYVFPDETAIGFLFVFYILFMFLAFALLQLVFATNDWDE